MCQVFSIVSVSIRVIFIQFRHGKGFGLVDQLTAGRCHGLRASFIKQFLDLSTTSSKVDR